jgi:hypothetical protein
VHSFVRILLTELYERNVQNGECEIRCMTFPSHQAMRGLVEQTEDNNCEVQSL